MAMDGPAEWAPDGNVTCHLFTCVMVKSTNGDVMGTKSDTRPMHNLPTVATTARIHRSTIERRSALEKLGRVTARRRSCGRLTGTLRAGDRSNEGLIRGGETEAHSGIAALLEAERFVQFDAVGGRAELDRARGRAVAKPGEERRKAHPPRTRVGDGADRSRCWIHAREPRSAIAARGARASQRPHAALTTPELASSTTKAAKIMSRSS